MQGFLFLQLNGSTHAGASDVSTQTNPETDQGESFLEAFQNLVSEDPGNFSENPEGATNGSFEQQDIEGQFVDFSETVPASEEKSASTPVLVTPPQELELPFGSDSKLVEPNTLADAKTHAPNPSQSLGQPVPARAADGFVESGPFVAQSSLEGLEPLFSEGETESDVPDKGTSSVSVGKLFSNSGTNFSESVETPKVQVVPDLDSLRIYQPAEAKLGTLADIEPVDSVLGLGPESISEKTGRLPSTNNRPLFDNGSVLAESPHKPIQNSAQFPPDLLPEARPAKETPVPQPSLVSQQDDNRIDRGSRVTRSEESHFEQSISALASDRSQDPKLRQPADILKKMVLIQSAAKEPIEHQAQTPFNRSGGEAGKGGDTERPIERPVWITKEEPKFSFQDLLARPSKEPSTLQPEILTQATVREAFVDRPSQPTTGQTEIHLTGLVENQTTARGSGVERSETLLLPQQIRGEQIVEQIVARARLIRSSHSSSFEIQLKPEFLGKVRIETTLDSNHRLTAVLHVQDPQVQTAVRSELPALLEGLSESGVKIDSIRVETDSANHPKEHNPSQKQLDQQRKDRHPASQDQFSQPQEEWDEEDERVDFGYGIGSRRISYFV